MFIQIKMICKIKKEKATSGKYRFIHSLYVDTEFYENLNLNEPVCSYCHSLIELPFYFCTEYTRIICTFCERSKLNKVTCSSQLLKDIHSHFLISKINVLDLEDNKTEA